MPGMLGFVTSVLSWHLETYTSAVSIPGLCVGFALRCPYLILGFRDLWKRPT